MSFYFTDQIQQSFNKIFHQCNKDIAWAGKAELDALVKLDEEGQKIPGIGDVYAILARVYSGPQFTWIEAGFPEDDTKAYSYLHTAIRKGSAIAILQAMRTSGALTPTIEKELPMTKDQAFQRVYEGAQKGCSTVPTPLPMYTNGGITTSYHRLERWLTKVNHLPLSVS